jgi:hypothetical protein
LLRIRNMPFAGFSKGLKPPSLSVCVRTPHTNPCLSLSLRSRSSSFQHRRRTCHSAQEWSVRLRHLMPLQHGWEITLYGSTVSKVRGDGADTDGWEIIDQ